MSLPLSTQKQNRGRKRKLSEQGIPNPLFLASEKIFNHQFGNEIHDASLSNALKNTPENCLLTMPCPKNLTSNFQKCVVKDKEAWMTIFMGTVNQSESSQWYNERTTRITASSKAHKISTRKRMFNSLAEQLVEPKQFAEGFLPEAMAYGVNNEAKARAKFENLTGYKVENCGLIVKMNQPYLAASLDGIILDDMSILEIKCPFSCKNSEIINRRVKKSYVSYLIYVEDDVTISKSHMYYTQVQMQMYVSNTTKCHFFVWSSIDQVHVIVERDEEFLQKLIPKLEKFYFDYYLPLL